jgi:hypothetical protein
MLGAEQRLSDETARVTRQRLGSLGDIAVDHATFGQPVRDLPLDTPLLRLPPDGPLDRRSAAILERVLRDERPTDTDCTRFNSGI